MEIEFPVELDERLNTLALESGRAKVQLVIEMVASHLSYEEWFRREVEKGLVSLDRGAFVEHAEVGRRMARFLGV